MSRCSAAFTCFSYLNNFILVPLQKNYSAAKGEIMPKGSVMDETDYWTNNRLLFVQFLYVVEKAHSLNIYSLLVISIIFSIVM
jgi:hypothetical protein